ncbi:DNA replication/repair protein RecF [Desulfurispora thermophila]|uniref:DNA replication/repair protein RecF n=1 Tax=Desulfurispora thermophila TaxID=265470 RepID=UPI00039F2941|nr:DNA replication/repair protein RecF [Desulfurispora thermophila]
MRLISLQPAGFRNLTTGEFKPGPGLNIIAGPNGQGKTNLLEAIYLISCGHSFRTSRHAPLISEGEGGCYLHGLFQLQDDVREVAAQISPGGSAFYLNQKKTGRLNIFQPGWAFVFTPEELDIITGSPDLRRRWLDRDICRVSKHYYHLLRSYQRALEQKSALLRRAEQQQRAEQLAVWNGQLVEHGSRVLDVRLRTLKDLSPLFKKQYVAISGGGENVYFNYLCSVKLPEPYNLEKIRENYYYMLAEMQEKEIARKQPLVGPHRDDIAFFLQGRPARHFASRGQCRSLVLAGKIAGVELFRRQVGFYPILLLDDILPELDRQRQQNVLDFLAGYPGQCFLTTSQPALPPGLPAATSVFYMEKGAIRV